MATVARAAPSLPRAAEVAKGCAKEDIKTVRLQCPPSNGKSAEHGIPDWQLRGKRRNRVMSSRGGLIQHCHQSGGKERC